MPQDVLQYAIPFIKRFKNLPPEELYNVLCWLDGKCFLEPNGERFKKAVFDIFIKGVMTYHRKRR